MKQLRLFLLLFLAFFASVNAQNQRERILLNSDWRFAKGHAANPAKDFNFGLSLSFTKTAFLQEATLLDAGQESKLYTPHTQQYDDSKWEKIVLPHDWAMRLGYGKEQLKVKGYRTISGRSPENSVGWYRKTFKLKTVKGSRYFLEFEGVFRDAQIWINGVYLGSNESGYVPFSFDVTEVLNYGDAVENVITVRADATQSELWSYEGAGIYRNVWLTRTSSVFIPQYGTYVTCKIAEQGGDAVVSAQVEVSNQTDKNVAVTVHQKIYDNLGTLVASASEKLNVTQIETSKIATSMTVKNAKMWSLESPVRYRLFTEIEVAGKVIDAVSTRFGIRTIRFDANEGFFLNGKRVQIQGACMHQDHACVGTAVPERLNYWRIAKLKEFGVNAYRASHNPPTTSVLEACDSLGMLVMDEIRLMNSSTVGLSQLETVIRRDRNHPSIIIWSMGNEENAIQGSEKGRLVAERMRNVLRKIDDTRPVTVAMNGAWGKGFSLAVDVQGSNYFKIGNIDRVHKDLPNLPILLSEEGSTVTTRGIYETNAAKGFHQAYDRDVPGWGATAQKWMRYVDQRKFIAGAFIWTGFDYGGESVQHYWPGVVSHFGIMDYCGFPKDAYWYYKAQWTNEPVLHILPHWNKEGLPKSDSVDVHLYTNMDEVELFLNGKSLGKKTVGKFDVPAFRVRYAAGKLLAKGNKNNVKYSTLVETTDVPSELQIIPETGTQIKNDGQDISILTIKVLDKKGRLVPTASNKLNFAIENGTILGVGNGHPSSHEPDNFAAGEAVYRNAFGGLAQVIVKGDGTGKPVNITVTSDGLKNATEQIIIK
jgi:beta-galactosidase